jgi:ribosomal protein S18 acetylase RimI-like enzyme
MINKKHIAALIGLLSMMQSAHSVYDVVEQANADNIQIGYYSRERHWLYVKRTAKANYQALGEDYPTCPTLKSWSESDAGDYEYMHYRVLEVNGVPKGFAVSGLPHFSIFQKRRIATVLQLAVSESRHGYGGMLLADAEEAVRKKDSTCPIMLGLMPGNTQALAFFQKYEFKVDPTEPSGLQLYKY